MATTNSSSKPAPACKKCGKQGFAAADGKMRHEQRADPAVYGGRRAEPGKQKKPAQDEAPDREHFLGKKVFGGTGRTE